MKFFIFSMVIFVFLGCSGKASIPKDVAPNNVSFNDVWNQVNSDEVTTYPEKRVSFFKLYDNGKSVIGKDSGRTLSDSRDIIEPFEKLAHPNGICLKGVWEIDTQNIYGGYFTLGSKALIIARASSAMGYTKRGKKRSFGFAGKLFPTMNAEKINTVSRANFFVIDDLGGTNARNYTDVSMTNEPKLSFTSSVAKKMMYGLTVSSTFKKVDKKPGIRQLYEVSYLGQESTEKIITPKWMKIEAFTKRDAKDFRDELKVGNEKLVFNIFVANKKVNKKKNFQRIGSMTFDTSVVSKTCDQRLHFHHPKWRNDLNYGF